ncbi:hypothetical protein TI05_10705 [Achromatium sp. WMS3]|nr:hypothetical protein TI05_10705 [Achromatium sp. WMS3]
MTKKLFTEQVMDQAASLCHNRGVKFTPQRRMVLEILYAADKPMSAYEILDLMRGMVKNPAPPTVYRALDFLREQGLVHKLESLQAFIGCIHPEYPHSSQFLICADCGGVSEINDAAIVQSLGTVSKSIGFQTKHPVVELLGTCAECTGKNQ